MSKKIILILAIVVIGGSAVCRPTHAYFSGHSSHTAKLKTADWLLPTTQVYSNNQAVATTDAKIDSNWFDCTTLESIGGESSNHSINIEADELPICRAKNISFELNQQKVISFMYQLLAAPLVELQKQPLVRFYWNDTEIAWLSHTTDASSWLSLSIPNNDATGKLSIKVFPVNLQITPTQFMLESITFQRIVVKSSSNITLTNHEAQTTVFFSIDNSTELQSGLSPISIDVSDLSETGALTFWSVDSWGNTETPKNINYQVITSQVNSPKILWQYYQDSKLYLVVKSNEQRNVLVKQYQLITDESVLVSHLEQPWISSNEELHQSGIPVSVSFLITGDTHAGRVQSIDQLGNESLASNLILF